jgi:transcriptional regulator with XRE-family HTH domain
MSTAHSFGELLRQLRMAAAVSREELAEQSGVSLKAIGALERGERTHPHQATVELLVQALDVGPSERAALVAAARSATRAPPVVEAAALARPRVPTPPTPLIGRRPDLAQTRALLAPGPAGARLVTLVGPGGVGKTRLALEIAAQMGGGFRDGAVLVDLAPLRDGRLVAAAVARALGVREACRRSARELLVDHLREKQLLLVLDNFEHLLGAAPLVAELLAGCAELTVLVTSRSALRLRSEHQFIVAPLGGAEPNQPLETIAAAPAVQLFVERVQAIEPEFALTSVNAGDVARICRHLDGLPLALELAAARMGVLQPGLLLRRLEHRLSSLTRGAADIYPSASARWATRWRGATTCWSLPTSCCSVAWRCLSEAGRWRRPRPCAPRQVGWTRKRSWTEWRAWSAAASCSPSTASLGFACWRRSVNSPRTCSTRPASATRRARRTAVGT